MKIKLAAIGDPVERVLTGKAIGDSVERVSTGRSSRRWRRLAGFSLLEASIGMGVIGTVVGAMLSGITAGTMTMRMTRENLRATQIMLEKVETIRLYNWDQVTTNYIPNSFTNYYDPQSNPGLEGLQYHGTLA